MEALNYMDSLLKFISCFFPSNWNPYIVAFVAAGALAILTDGKKGVILYLVFAVAVFFICGYATFPG